MDFKTMNKVGHFLEQATPEQITQLAQNMADKAPHLMPVVMTDKEKVINLIKIHLAQLADSPTDQALEYYHGYTQGLVAGAYVVGVLSDEENEHYHYEADRVADEAEKRIEASNEQ